MHQTSYYPFARSTLRYFKKHLYFSYSNPRKTYTHLSLNLLTNCKIGATEDTYFFYIETVLPIFRVGCDWARVKGITFPYSTVQ